MKRACERWEPMLSRYLDGELEEREASTLQEHVRSCDACRAELQSFRELSTLLASHVESDPFFVARFRARREELWGGNGSLQLWRRLAVRLLPLAAAAFLGAAAAVWLTMEETGLAELEARQLGDGFLMAAEEGPNPVLQIAFEPFPGGEH